MDPEDSLEYRFRPMLFSRIGVFGCGTGYLRFHFMAVEVEAGAYITLLGGVFLHSPLHGLESL